MSAEDTAIYDAADALHAALVELLKRAPADGLADCAWDFDDEDWLRDGILGAADYAEWRETGRHRLVIFAPGLDAGRVFGDQMARAAWRIVRDADRLRLGAPPEVQAEALSTSQRYSRLREAEATQSS